MAKWYCRLKGKQVGPLTASQLLKLVKSGEVKPGTSIRKDDSQWVVAESVNGLFKSAGVETALPRCPYCGTIVERLPTRCPTCQRQVDSTYV